MNIYQLKPRGDYVGKSLKDENFGKNIYSSMQARTNIFLIDEYFNPISITDKGSSFIKVYIYKINKSDSEPNKYIKSRNAYSMTIFYEETDALKSISYPKHITINNAPEFIELKFLNSYLDSNINSRKIQKIRDRMTFLRYAIEYK